MAESSVTSAPLGQAPCSNLHVTRAIAVPPGSDWDGRALSLSLTPTLGMYVQYSSAYREPYPARRTIPLPARPSLPPLCPETLAPSVLQRVIQINL